MLQSSIPFYGIASKYCLLCTRTEYSGVEPFRKKCKVVSIRQVYTTVRGVYYLFFVYSMPEMFSIVGAMTL